MDVSFLQVEAAGHRAVADPLREQGEGQQDGVGQGQTSPSGHTDPGFGALKQVCDVLGREKKKKEEENHVTVANISRSGDSTGTSGETDHNRITTIVTIQHRVAQ